MNFASEFSKCPLIAILRGVLPGEIIAVCETLQAAGIRLLEIPLNSPDAIQSIRLAAARFHPAGQLWIGAGTVLNTTQVSEVVAAGGKFMISPNCDGAVIRASRAAGAVSIPGFLTPTEAFAAQDAGADYLKLFPAGSLGPAYINDLRAVIAKPILAVGGINRENLADFLQVSDGVGIGSALYKPGKSATELRRDAEWFVSIARSQ